LCLSVWSEDGCWSIASNALTAVGKRAAGFAELFENQPRLLPFPFVHLEGLVLMAFRRNRLVVLRSLALLEARCTLLALSCGSVDPVDVLLLLLFWEIQGSVLLNAGCVPALQQFFLTSIRFRQL
jgi:hypothetical protein